MSGKRGADDEGLPTLGELFFAACAQRTKLRKKLREARQWPKRHERRPGTRRLLGSAAAILLIMFVTGLALEKLDPFGVSRATKQHSALVAARLHAPFYGEAKDNGTAQDHIAVVLINEETLRERQSSWPPRYSYHEEVLRRVLRQRPRAVYYDIFVDGGRDFDDSLEDARDALAEDLLASRTPDGHRVPLYFGIPRIDTRLALTTDDNASPLIAAWHGMGSDYPLVIPKRNGGISPHPGKNVGELTSVALALYRAACVNRDAGCAQPASLLGAIQPGDALSVSWGAARPAFAPSPECVNPQRNGWQQAIGLAVDSLLSGISPSRVDSERQRCPYTLTLLEHQLDDEHIAALLQDRVVLVGTQLSGMEDITQSPVHSALPGVYLHAMALDNLMTWGNRHPQRSEAKGFAFSLAMAMLISLGAAWIFGNLAQGRWIALLILAIVATTCALTIPWYQLRQPPPDWLGAFALFSAVLFGLQRYVTAHKPVVTPPARSPRRNRKRRSH